MRRADRDDSPDEIGQLLNVLLFQRHEDPHHSIVVFGRIEDIIRMMIDLETHLAYAKLVRLPLVTVDCFYILLHQPFVD